MTARGPTERGRFNDADLFLAIGCAVTVGVVFSVQYFPYVDSTNHLARYVFIARSWMARAPEGVSFHWIPTSYIGLDVIGAALASLFSAPATLRILSLIALLLPTAGLYALLRAVDPARRGWALAGLLLAFNWFAMIGFLNYAIGVGLALLWLAAWWRSRRDLGVVKGLALAIGAALLYLVHLAASATVLVVVGMELLLDITVRRTADPKPSPSGTLRTFYMLVAVSVVTAALIALMHANAPSVAPAVPGIAFRSVVDKVTHLLTPLYVFSKTQLALLVLAYGAAVVALLARSRLWPPTDTWIGASIALVGAYVVFPTSFLGGYDADVRFLLPAFLILFCAKPKSDRPVPRSLLVFLLACMVAHATVVGVEARRIDRELRDYLAVLRTIPPTARVLPLVADQLRHGRVDAYRHFVHWRGIETNTVMPGLFGTTTNATVFAHFRIRRAPYFPHEDWGTKLFVPLDWTRIRADYDYIILLGGDERAMQLIRGNARQTTRQGDAVMFELLD